MEHEEISQNGNPVPRYSGDRAAELLLEDVTAILTRMKNNNLIKSFGFKNKELLLSGNQVHFYFILPTKDRHEISVNISFLGRPSLEEVIEAQRALFPKFFLNTEKVRLKHVARLIYKCVHARLRGFNLEGAAFKVMDSYSSKNPDAFILSVQKTTSEQDLDHVDFIVKVRVEGEEFPVSFDLKSTEKYQEIAAARFPDKPTIVSSFKELKRNRRRFIYKIKILAKLTYKKLFQNKNISDSLFHISDRNLKELPH